MSNPLIETWQIHDRINRYVLDAVAESSLGDISASKGRTVEEQFAHIHAVRLMWLKAADPALLGTQQKLEKGGLTKADLAGALTDSTPELTPLLTLKLL